ncbi:amidase [Medicago truncatula]|uniref:Amidase n=1 Tax=Medicago truncatula TaxID=3880 RepID=G7LH08_MEDTR|nr:amidase [Medicago truncatula]
MQCVKAQVHNTNYEHTWLKPLVGKIKCIVDVVAFNNNSIMRHDMCDHDSTRSFLLDKSYFSHSSVRVLEIEFVKEGKVGSCICIKKKAPSCGVIFIGKTNMHEFGMGTTGNNSNYG